MQKGAISTIIASVLTVLITVAAVTLLWVGIQPLLSGAAFIDPIDVIFSIEKENSFTFFDPDRGYLSVQIQRGSDDDDPEVRALKFLINIEGNTITRKTSQVMPPNQRIVYYFLVGFVEEVDSVKVVPIYYVDGKEVEGQTFTIDAKIPKRGGELLGEIPIIEIDDDPDIPFSDGLVLYYSFDEGFVNDNFVLDQSGNGHDGKKLDNPQVVLGKVGNAMQFDATDDSPSGDLISDALEILGGVELMENTLDEKTITFWADFDCNSAPQFQSPFGSSQNYYIQFYNPCSSVNRLFVSRDSLNIFTGVNWNSVNGWEYYSVVIRDDGSVTVYLNGEPKSPSTVTGSYDPKSNFFLGAMGGTGSLPGDYFKGSLDNFRIYDRALDPEEIEEIFLYENT